MHPRMPRMTSAAIMAALLLCLIALIAPQQLPIIAYKISLVTLAGLCGYCFDRALFPYARPDKFQGGGTASRRFIAAQLRRAAIVCACMLATGLGL